MIEDRLSLPEEVNRQDSRGESLAVEKAIQEYVVLNTSDVRADESSAIQHTAVLYIASYVVLYGLTQVLAKYLMHCGLSPFEILSARGSVSVLLDLLYLFYTDTSLFDVEGSKARTVLIGALIGFLSLCGHYIALSSLTLGVALSVEYVSYHFSTFFDSVIYFLWIRCFQLVGYVCAFLGVVALLFERHDESAGLPIGLLFGLMGSFLAGAHSAIVHGTVTKVNPVLCVIYVDFVSACFAPAAAMLGFQIFGVADVNRWYFLAMVIALGVIGWGANMMLAKSIREEKLMSRPYMFRYALVGVGFAVDLWCGDLTVLSCTGMLLVGTQFALAVC